MSYGPSELDQSSTETGNIFQVKISADNWAIGQSIVPSKTGLLDYVIFKLYKVGSPTGNAVCKAYADDGSSPTGSALSTSSNVDVSGLGTTPGAEVTFQFPNDYLRRVGTKYWAVIEVDYAQSAANYIVNHSSLVGDYASGNRNRKQSDDVWKDDQGTQDMYFKEYILPYIADGGNPMLFGGGVTIG